MTILDRMLLKTFLRAYVICLVSTLSLYIVVDLFTNLDDFASQSKTLAGVVQHILIYYGYQVLQYTDRLSEIIVLLAGMFTVAWMQRANEILPLLSAGVSTRRILRPILIGAAGMFLLVVVNQEFIIPSIAGELMKDRHDFFGEKDVYVSGAFDASGVHVEGIRANRKDLTVESFYAVLPETRQTGMIQLAAKRAKYVPLGSEKQSGGWLLLDTIPAEVPAGVAPESLTQIDAGKYFLKTRDVDFTAITRDPKWFNYASTDYLDDLLNNSETGGRLAPIAVTFHMRITRPIVGMILLAMGLSVILRDQTRNVAVSAGMCIGMCAAFYGVVFACRFMGNNEFIAPALAAWMPVLIFGPLTFALYDAVQT